MFSLTFIVFWSVNYVCVCVCVYRYMLCILFYNIYLRQYAVLDIRDIVTVSSLFGQVMKAIFEIRQVFTLTDHGLTFWKKHPKTISHGNIFYSFYIQNGLPRWLSGREFACWCRGHRFSSWPRVISWRRKWQPIPVFLLRKYHGQRSL